MKDGDTVGIYKASRITGYSVRQLRHFDETGAVKAHRVGTHGFRRYDKMMLDELGTKNRAKKASRQARFKEALTTSQTARILGCSTSTVILRVKSGLIKFNQRGNRVVFSADQIREFASAHPDLCPKLTWPDDSEILLTLSKAADYLGVSRGRMTQIFFGSDMKADARTRSGLPLFLKSELQLYAIDNKKKHKDSAALRDVAADNARLEESKKAKGVVCPRGA